MYPLKQSTALTVVFFAHDINGDAVNSLTDGSWTKRQSKNGGSFAAMTVTITYMENGWYSLPLSTAHTDTLGINTIVLTNAGCKQVNLQYRVHARLPDDLAFPATSGRSIVVDSAGLVDSNVVKLGPTGAGTAQTARDVGGQLDAAITSRMASYTQPTGFLAATFPTTIASPTNITAGVITTVTNLTNAPTVGDLTATMKASVTTAATAATPVAASVAGNVVGSVGSVAGNVVGSVGSVAGNVVGSVGSVAGDIAGKILGGGAGTITGVGVRAVDGSGNAIAPASTALSTAVWTGTLASYLDAAISSRAPSATALSTAVWTGTLASYLDAAISSRAPSSTALSNATWTTAKANFIDAAVTSRMATYTQPTGFLAATFPVSVAAVGSAMTLDTDAVNANALATDAVTELVNAVWANTTRTLTSSGGITPQDIADIADAVWTEAIRTLTSSPVDAQDIADIADAVWTETVRTLTSAAPLSTQDKLDIAVAVWANVTRTLTSMTTDPLLTEIHKLTGNNVTRVGDIITVYEDDEVTVFRTYSLENGGRIIQS